MKCVQMPLPSALYLLEKQSGYYKVNYNYDLLKTYKVTTEINQQAAPQAVEMLLASTPYTSKVDGKMIREVKKKQQDDASLHRVSGQLLDSYGHE